MLYTDICPPFLRFDFWCILAHLRHHTGNPIPRHAWVTPEGVPRDHALSEEHPTNTLPQTCATIKDTYNYKPKLNVTVSKKHTVTGDKNWAE